MRTARRLGIETVAIYSDADRRSMHVLESDHAIRVGASRATESYLNQDAILSAARETGADAIHPGYGFLSENPTFAEAVATHGIEFIGPSPSSIRLMGLKDTAKRVMQEANVPTVPGFFGAGLDDRAIHEEADKLGFPVMVKAVAGGGGKGMRVVYRREKFGRQLERARSEALSAFGNDKIFVEKLVACPRHIEVQVFGDKFGNVVHLFERDCSVQRRHQKIVEEAPAPGLSDEMRRELGNTAIKAAGLIDYVGAGTVEFIADAAEGVHPDRCWFMEMNTRLQVEHPVTEEILGVDLVEWQFRVAAGEKLPVNQDDLLINGNAMEVRIYAEDVARGFLPSSGMLTRLDFPRDIRIESGVQSGDAVSPLYDPMIAKLVAGGVTREEARRRLVSALDETIVLGPATNVGFLGAVLRNAKFVLGGVSTDFVNREIMSNGETINPPDVAVALAALAAAGFSRGGHSESGFTLWQQMRQEIQLECGERRRIRAEISFESAVSASVEFEGNTLKCRLESGWWHANGVHADAPLKLQGRRVAVALGGFWEFEIPDNLFHDCDLDDGAVAPSSPMSGSIRAVHVVLGQAVERGTPIAVVEAMKMEHTVLAPRSGIVEEVFVKAGDLIEEGMSLARLGDIA